MAGHLTAGVSSSVVPVSLLPRSSERQQGWQLHFASPLECTWASRRKSSGRKCCWRIVESRVVSQIGFGDARTGRDFFLPNRVLDRNDVKGLRAVKARAESQEKGGREKVDYKVYQALMRGGEEVTEMMKEMAELLEDIAGFEKDEEEAAVRMAAAGVVGQKLEKLEGSFLMALDWMIEQTEKEKDDKKLKVLELIKETVLAQVSNKSPSQVQVVSALCTTSCKDARQEILRRCAGGGGTFNTERGGNIQLPGANLLDIANQADDIISTMEEKPLVPDRRLLAKLLLVREEARSLLGGGILDERNDNKKFTTLPDTEVNFLSKLVALKPGPQVRERLAKVMRGKDEGEEKARKDINDQPRRRQKLINIGKDVNTKGEQRSEEIARPVRPGIFLETLTKLLAGMYATNTAGGITVQQLEWIHRITLDILQEMAYS